MARSEGRWSGFSRASGFPARSVRTTASRSARAARVASPVLSVCWLKLVIEPRFSRARRITAGTSAYTELSRPRPRRQQRPRSPSSRRASTGFGRASTWSARTGRSAKRHRPRDGSRPLAPCRRASPIPGTTRTTRFAACATPARSSGGASSSSSASRWPVSSSVSPRSMMGCMSCASPDAISA